MPQYTAEVTGCSDDERGAYRTGRTTCRPRPDQRDAGEDALSRGFPLEASSSNPLTAWSSIDLDVRVLLGASAVAGSVRRKVLPTPTSDSTSSVPWSISASRREIGS